MTGFLNVLGLMIGVILVGICIMPTKDLDAFCDWLDRRWK